MTPPTPSCPKSSTTAIRHWRSGQSSSNGLFPCWSLAASGRALICRRCPDSPLPGQQREPHSTVGRGGVSHAYAADRCGSGTVQEKEKARLGEIIAKVNDLFGADTTEGDKLVYVNDVIKGKLMESDTLRQQAVSNSKEQFANSPDLNH